MKTTAAAFLALLCGLAAGSRIPSRDLDATRPVVDASQVAAINADPASTFRAALDPRFASMSVAEARRMFGLKMLTPEQSRQCVAGGRGRGRGRRVCFLFSPLLFFSRKF
jgi:hypothetical protein